MRISQTHTTTSPFYTGCCNQRYENFGNKNDVLKWGANSPCYHSGLSITFTVCRYHLQDIFCGEATFGSCQTCQSCMPSARHRASCSTRIGQYPHLVVSFLDTSRVATSCSSLPALFNGANRCRYMFSGARQAGDSLTARTDLSRRRLQLVVKTPCLL